MRFPRFADILNASVSGISIVDILINIRENETILFKMEDQLLPEEVFL